MGMHLTERLVRTYIDWNFIPATRKAKWSMAKGEYERAIGYCKSPYENLLGELAGDDCFNSYISSDDFNDIVATMGFRSPLHYKETDQRKAALKLLRKNSVLHTPKSGWWFPYLVQCDVHAKLRFYDRACAGEIGLTR